MNSIDAWRRNEAEARQEMQTRTCTNCGVGMEDCDAYQCKYCHEYWCKSCLPGQNYHGDICPTCQDAEDIFNEVAEIDQPGPLDITEFKREQTRDDTLTEERWTK
jgi:hypothetical protein